MSEIQIPPPIKTEEVPLPPGSPKVLASDSRMEDTVSIGESTCNVGHLEKLFIYCVVYSIRIVYVLYAQNVQIHL